MRVPLGMTRRSHPAAGWQNVPGTHVWYVIFQDPEEPTDVFLEAYSERTGNRFERPCTDPRRAYARVFDFARQWG